MTSGVTYPANWFKRTRCAQVETLIEEEVALRSKQFVEVSTEINDVSENVGAALERLLSFKRHLHWLDAESYRHAAAVQQLQRRRNRLDAMTQVRE